MPFPAPPLLTPFVAPAPNRGQDEEEFNTNQQNFVNSQFNYVPEQNALAVWHKSAADFTEEKANAAEQNAISAANSATAASSAANYRGEWSSLTGPLNKNVTVSNNGAFWVLLNDLPNVALSEPNPGNADWVFTSGTRWLTYDESAELNPNSQSIITAIHDAADMGLPVLAAKDFMVLHNSSVSSKAVRLLNSLYTIRGPRGEVEPGENLILNAGDTLHLVAVSPLILEVV